MYSVVMEVVAKLCPGIKKKVFYQVSLFESGSDQIGGRHLFVLLSRHHRFYAWDREKERGERETVLVADVFFEN